MKMRWEEPRILAEKFMPNEYVAACGDTEYGNYLFECDAPAGTLYYYPQSDGKIDGQYSGGGKHRKDGKLYSVWCNSKSPYNRRFL